MLQRYSFFLVLLSFSCVNHDLSPREEIEEPFVCDTTVSWQTDILPVMEASCATSGCHDGIARRDWTDYDEVKEYAESIRKRTVDRSMPFDGPPLPQHQIDMIACWVDNGAVEN